MKSSRSATSPASVHAGTLLASHGCWKEAIAAYQALLEHDRDNLAALRPLGALLQSHGLREQARQVRARIADAEAKSLQLSESERDAVIAFFCAAAGDADAPLVVPPSYVSRLFDHYAAEYDERLERDLHYRGPDALFDLVAPTLARHTGLDVLDLGCGTGLVGMRFRSLAGCLTGVDLSAEMILRANAKGCYDCIEVSEIADFLTRGESRYDLIVASDVLNYFGDLSAVLVGCAARLRENGRLVINVEAADENEATDYYLAATRRYRHSRDYLTRQASDAGLVLLAVAAAELRRQGGEPVRAHVCVFAGVPAIARPG